MNKAKIKKLQIEADIIILEREIIPDLKEQLDWLTRPDYDPSENPDHEYRDADIAELAKEVDDLRRLIERLK